MQSCVFGLWGLICACLLDREAAQHEDALQVDQPFHHDGKGSSSAYSPIQTGNQVRAEFSAKIPWDDRYLQPGQSRSFWNITSQGPVFIKGHSQVIRGGQ